MLKPLFCIFIFGALLHGVVSDIKCYLDGLATIVVAVKLQNNCDVLKASVTILKALDKTCSTNIDISKVDSLVNDLCNADSEITKKYVANKQCFDSKSEIASTECKQAELVELDMRDSTDIVEDVKKICPKLDPFFKCWKKNIGDPCGADGSQVMKTVTEAMSSYAKSVCDRVNGVSATGAVSWVVLLGILLVMMLQKY